MFKHRRVRTAVVLVVAWGALTGVERWGESAAWPKALLQGLLWASVVTAAWWFADWTRAGSPQRRRLAGSSEER
ncbi:hypothetical protein OG311_00505 [Streptomyces sp. NBC_01343]|uniref:hypothetical protein n=1 Tax=Streptomyces sp. NBC_01343 TaxID=2903832 RepID=UPI002E10F6B5|nr:hypothetical protein OG311_00505 [Streptomyces sp. NBC_01343]